MGFGDIASATETTMQDWSLGFTSTPEFKTEQLYKVDESEPDVIRWVPQWRLWNGFYRTILDVKGPLDTNVLWAVGMGWKSPKKAMLDKIKGNGKDIFDTIIANLATQYMICGDAFAEEIRDNQGRLVNLKPLNPGEIRIVATKLGMILRYEQIANAEAGQEPKILNTWQPDEMLHLSWNRIANEIHGISMIEKNKSQIIKINQARDLMAVIYRRYAIPVIVWEVDTDNTAEMTAFKVKQDNIFKKVENLVVPIGAAKATQLQMNKGSIEEGVTMIKSLTEDLTRGFGVPAVTQGSESGSSEATSKILHLNYQPRGKYHRTFIEKQMKAQLNIEINFDEPPSIDPSLLTDARKRAGGDKVDDNKLKETK